MSEQPTLRLLSGAEERKPPRRKRRRPAPVQVTYLPTARCPACGHLRTRQVPGCDHGPQPYSQHSSLTDD